ncbi:hypothetical protein G647_09727 [Cladophialophora carrionii CBS 160.54]|uniref:ATP synthase subunit K, mitochondrial n=1 Tax=Cladophialophora carrionii CBS 160.54 TaxID=1279043 RepID=V9DLK5_9EURO|nr:uncharacterized protein G647_09727 [Cladophialophora carrionii CBS 160.54]ETI27536.1 hypothetical protein G647_09727 [Cladophialophora carrionii CBS 160.54]
MVAMYTIAGRQVGSHVLSMATLGTVFAIPFLLPGGSKNKNSSTPPINASSKDEEKFIQDFLKQIEQEEKANKISGKEAH